MPVSAQSPITSPPGKTLRWINSFAALGVDFHTPLAPRPLPAPHWVARSEAAARSAGFPEDWHRHPDWQALEVFSGNALWPEMAPVATVYSGHQFGVWAGQLGDGRAHLLGEIERPDGSSLEIQLKGSGITPYSRMGDGRAVLRSSIREFLCSEAMHALGIPTTRALCVTGSPAPVRRETIESAAVVTRLAPSFVRFGHFEHFAHHDRPQALRRLADHVIERFYPECREQPQPAAALLEAVARRTAALIADWQAVGFCHGVMNTDNMSILGLTIDYGPFGFLDAFDPGHICNHSDDSGRYAYGRQPQIGYWNLYALAQALLPLIGDTDAAAAAADVYRQAFAEALQRRMSAKLGLQATRDGDAALAEGLLARMAQDRVDHTIAWRRLCDFDSAEGAANAPLRDLFVDREGFDAWAAQYRARLRQENSDDAARRTRMLAVNPKYVLRNHLAQQAIEQAERGDFDEVQRLLAVLERPFDEQPDNAAYADFPPDWARHIEVSCSS